MKKLHINIKCTSVLITTVLCISLLLLLSGCSESNGDIVDKITITDTAMQEYSEKTENTARQILYSFLYSYESAKSSKPLIQSQLDDINLRATEYQRISAEHLIPEDKYIALFRLLESKKDEIVSALTSKDSDTAGNLYKTLYLEISEHVGKEYLGHTIYSLGMYAYEDKYNKQIALYERDGHAYQLVKANEYFDAMEALKNDIRVENITKFIDFAFFFSELFAGGIFDTDYGINFSDAEILALISYLDFSDLTIGQDGWELIITTFGDSILLLDKRGFLDKTVFHMAQNGDAEKVASVMNELLALMDSVKSKLTASDAYLIRNGMGEELIASAFAKFDSEDYARLNAVCSININSAEYCEIASKTYGENFENYYENYEVATQDQLRASVNTDRFTETLKGYIAGICPAFAYAMFY